jgi:hypothetical protein
MTNYLLPGPNVPDWGTGVGNMLASIPNEIRQNRIDDEKMNYLRASEDRKAQEFNVDMGMKVGEWAYKAGSLATTPEMWGRLQQTYAPYAEKYGFPDLPDYEGRDEWLKEGSALFGEKESPWSVVEKYNEGGQPTKVLFNKKTLQERPFGGAKAQSGGISFTTPDGSTIEIGGDGSNAALANTTQGQVQQKAINTAEMGARVSSIATDFKPEYLTLGSRLANTWRSGVAKIDPGSLGAGDQKALADFSAFKSRSLGNLNRFLNELSGAAISPAEAERLRAEMPDPGTGVFDGDDPVSFKAKLDRLLTDANAALARYRFYQATGIPNNIEEIPLSNVKRGPDGIWRVMKDGKVYRIGEIAEER